jgi:O-acetyl-ADP-ribose deacetylase (regulator of RNase III)
MITYLKGDATQPKGTGSRIIAHVCNNKGGWGAGFVLAISKRWKKPEQSYRNWAKGNGKIPFVLGNVEVINVEPNLYVANMIAQDGYRNNKRAIPLQYDALIACLTKLAAAASLMNASIHMPRIGCGLAGGTWSIVEKIIEKSLYDVPVFVYDYG